jgi:hypothetical protein
MLLILRVRDKSVRPTEDPLRECLVDGREQAKTIIVVESTSKNLERQQLRLRRRTVHR